MRGIIITGLENYIISEYGISLWHETLDECLSNEQQIILSAGCYNDETVFQMLSFLARKLSKSGVELEQEFGYSFFNTIKEYYGFLINDVDSFDNFLQSLENMIHTNIKKVQPEASLPAFTVQGLDKGWSLKYQSSQKLCYLAIGLLKGSAEHFGKSINIEHEKCMHYGEEYCLFNITFAID